jgi:3-keto-5-aminohexanoate cleavage enzyme
VDKVFINFAPTGMIPTRHQTPYVPVLPQEIIEDVKQAYGLGITMVHLHARDDVSQEPCHEKETYAYIIEGIRKFAPDLIICVSTSGRTYREYERRSDVLQLKDDLKPDMASLTLGSVNFNKQASVNEPSIIIRLAEEMSHRGIKPELEAFDAGMINYAKYLIKRGILKPPFYFNLILGNIACAQADLLHAGIMIKDLPEQSIFSLGGVGDYQLRINSLAIAMGYGARVGIEDNIWYDRNRTKLATNTELIKRIKEIALANDMETMSSPELRRLLNLKKGYGEYGIAG